MIRFLQYLFIAIVTVTVGFSLYQWNASRAALTVNTSQNFNTNGLVGHWTFDGADTVWTSSTAGTTSNASVSSFPTVVSSVAFPEDGTFNSQQTITLPSGIVTGNLLVLVLRSYSSDLLTAAGWALLSSSSVGGDYSNIYYRTADGSEGSTVTFTTNGGGSSNTSGVAYQISGFSSIEASYAASNVVDPPTLTPSWGQANTLWIAFIDGARGDWGTASIPTNYTNSLIGQSGNSSSASMSVSAASRQLSASSENPSTFVTSGIINNPRAGLIAIAPAVFPAMGTLTNMNQSTSPVDGKIGQALNFDGVNDHVNLGNNPSYPLATPTTYSAWIYPNSSTNGVIVAHNCSTIGDGRMVSFLVTGTNQLTLRVSTSATDADFLTSNNAIVLNTWQHVAVTWDGDPTSGHAQIYVNGIAQSVTGGGSGIPSIISSNVYIGQSSCANPNPFLGKIDDVRIYNRVLSAAEITSLHTSGTAKLNVSQDSNLTKGLTEYWKFDNGSGTTATNSSTKGSTSDGTLTGSPLPTWGTGRIGSGLDFNGTNGAYVLGPANYTGFNNDYTISVWVKSTDTTTTNKTLVMTYNGFGSTSMKFYFKKVGINQAIEFSSVGGGSSSYIHDITDGNWHHLVATRTIGGVETVYADGVQIGQNTTTTGTLTMGFGNTTLRIGGRDSASMNGSLDEVRIYNRALSADEISQLYRLNTPTGVDTGLKGHWSFDGADVSGTTAYDRSGAGNNGTLTNGPVITEGQIGQGILLDGVDDRVAFPASVTTAFASASARSVSIWMKTTGAAAAFSMYAFSAGNGPPDRYYIGVDADGLGLQTAVGDGTDMSSTTLRANEWYHVVVTYEGGVAKTYLNGTLDSQASVTLTGSGTVCIGAYLCGGGNLFNGSVDDVRIYNRAISQREVQSLYDFGASDKVNSSVSQNQGTGRLDSGLAGYWKFDDGSGATAVDSSTNGNNGTLVSTPTWITGRIGGGLTFNGANYVSTTQIPLTSTVPNGFSVFVWLQSPNADAWAYEMGGSNAISLMTSATGTYCRIRDTSLGFFSTPRSTINGDGNWHHFGCVFNKSANVLTLYVDGVSSGTVSTSGFTAFDNGGAPFYLGGRGYGTDGINGSLDEMRIYSRALSADEISQLYRLTTPTGTDTSLKGYWSFNGPDLSGTTAYDRSGSGNNGTTSGATITEGKFGQALSFDGTDDLIQIGSPASLDNITNFSYSAWMNLLGPPENSDARIFAKNIGGFDDTGVSLDYDTGIFHGDILRAFVGFNTTDALATSQSLWSIIGGGSNYRGGWQHVAMTFDGTSKVITLYLNGVEVSYQTHTTGVGTRDNDAADNFTIGNNIFGQRTFNGKIDEPRVYNRILSAGEVQSLYNSGR